MFVYTSELEDGVATAHDTTMTFTTFVMFVMFNALGSRSSEKSIFKIGFFSNPTFLYAVGATLVAQLCVIYVPFLQNILQTVPISLSELLFIVALASTVFWADEIRKLFFVKPASRLTAIDGFDMV